MIQTKYLDCGFVSESDGKVIYDHNVRARITYADAFIDLLKSDATPALATLHSKQVHMGAAPQCQPNSTPLFNYKKCVHNSEVILSGLDLVDALTKRSCLPVFLADSGEVKDLMPFLNRKQKQDAMVVIHILRARYITAEKPRSQLGVFVKAPETTRTIQVQINELAGDKAVRAIQSAGNVDTNVVSLKPAAANTEVFDSVAHL